MEIWQAIILGAVQGFAEFLPVSSSGHLILLSNWLNIKENTLFYSVTLHIGTLIPVFIVMKNQILDTIKNAKPKLINLVLATIPAGVIGLIFSLVLDLDTLFEQNRWLLSLTFLITAVQMFLCQNKGNKKGLIKPINAKTSLIMGLGQAIGVLPGVSRSGSTITFGNLAKVDKENNANFTFLMSIPIILAALFMQVLSLVTNGESVKIDIVPLTFGLVTSAVCGYIAINSMLKVIKKANYKWFGLYLVLISIINLITCF